MSWVRLDDQFADHPKVAGLSNDAFCLHVTAMCWTAKQQTDGKLPSRLLSRLAWRCQDPATAAAELQAAGVWDKTPEGWEIHDFLVYNPTKEQAAELAAKRSEAGKAGATARWQSDGKSHGSVDGKTMPPSPSPSPSPIPGSTVVAPPESAQTPLAIANPAATPVVVPVSLPEWTERLRDSSNRQAVLVQMIQTLYPNSLDVPSYAYVAKVASKVGGAGRLAELLWQNSAKPPSGDVLAYIQAQAKPGANGTRPSNAKATSADLDAIFGVDIHGNPV
jgi:hypothetical protein